MDFLPSMDSLKCFLAAAKYLNFRRAAQDVALTPAAVGQRIRGLEDQLGTPLFRRTTREVELTEAGLHFFPHAEAIVERARLAFRAAHGETPRELANITLGTRHELGLSWIVPRVSELEKRDDALTLHLYFGSGVDLLMRLRNRELDCVVGSMRSGDPKLANIPMHREDYVFVGAASILKKHPLRNASDASAHSLIDVNAELPLYGYFREAHSESALFDWKSIRQVGTIAGIRQYVLRGLGVAVLPHYLVEKDLEQGRLKRLFPKLNLAHDYFRLFYRHEDMRRTRYEWLAHALMEWPLR